MNDYDFSTLNDKEFEVLCTDLIGAGMGVRFERFKPGRDGGVDGRYYTPSGTEWILQAKHRPGTAVPQLVTHLRNTEAPKVAALNPERYILAVSHSLSRLNKEQLIDALRSHATCPVEVFDRGDLNDLLAKNPSIERRHFKLWISSAAVLTSLLNNAINGRSEAMMQDIVDKSKIFVQTENFKLAMLRLNQLGTVIITGQAGIGKTTLAEQLILLYASHGFQLTCISEHIDEAEQAYMPDQRQLFYFDDFLGRNYLQALSGHEGSQIANFIKRVSRDRATKKFVLTSRSTILNQGRMLNDVFEHNKLHRNEMEIKLDSLSGLDKAHILYNHIWHSGLTLDYIDQFYTEKRYLKVINHRNFNPRLIQFITDPQRLDTVPASEYWDHVQGLLENPEKIWAHPFDAQLDDYGRFLVLLVAFNGQNIPEQHLARAYADALQMPSHANFVGKRDFHYAIRHLSNSLITRVVIGKKAYYKLFNPSLGDFLLHRYSNSPDSLEAVFKCLRSQSALNVLLDVSDNRLLDREPRNKILTSLLEHEKNLSFKDSDPEYLSRLYLSATKALPSIAVTGTSTATQENTKRFREIIQVLMDIPFTNNCSTCLLLIRKAHTFNVIDLNELLSLTLKAIEFEVKSEDLNELGELVARLEVNGIDDASEPFSDLALSTMIEGIEDMFDEDKIFEGGDYYDDACKQLERMIKDKFTSWQIAPTQDMIDEVVYAFDIYDRMNNYFDESNQYSPSPRSAQNRLEIMNIDDLFSRDR